MRRVLNRDVKFDGKMYRDGTDVSLLPEDFAKSATDTGWTRLVADEPAADPQGTSVESSDEAPETSSGQKVADPQQPAKAPEAGSDVLVKDQLSEELTNLLASANITTVADADKYLATNKTFRTIEGVTKAKDESIRKGLNL